MYHSRSNESPASKPVIESVQSIALIMHRVEGLGDKAAVDVSVHDLIANKDGGYLLGAGSVVGQEERDKIGQIIRREQAQDRLVINDKVLAQTSSALAWWMPPSERDISFKSSKGVETFRLKLPACVGVYSRGEVYFASVRKGKGKSRPDNDTPLFYCPFIGNQYELGNICRGSAVIEQRPTPSAIPSWESFLFDTTNTHLGSVKPLILEKAFDYNFAAHDAIYDRCIEVWRSHDGTDKTLNTMMTPMKKRGANGRLQPKRLGEWLSEIDSQGGR